MLVALGGNTDRERQALSYSTFQRQGDLKGFTQNTNGIRY